MQNKSRFQRFTEGLDSLKTDFQEFRQTLSKAEIKTKEAIDKIKDGHPFVAKVVDAGIDFLPPPANKIASFIWNISDGSDEEKTSNVIKYLEKIEAQGNENFETTLEKLDEIKTTLEENTLKLSDVEKNMAQEQTLNEIQVSLDASKEQVLEKLENVNENLKNQLDKGFRKMYEKLSEMEQKITSADIPKVDPFPEIFLGEINNDLFLEPDDQIQNITNMLRANPIVSIIGEGGMGETQIAYKAIHQCDDIFDVVIPIRFDQKPDIDAEFASVLGIHDGNTTNKQQLILNELSSRKHPLVLADSYENVLSSEMISEINQFLESRPPNTNILFTSRRRNNLAGEIPYEIKDLKNNTGANLFVRYAKRYFQNELTGEIKEKLKEISAKTGGHPLALEILARIYRGSKDELDKMMLELGKGVEITSKDGRHTSLEKSFRYSYRLLDVNQQKALQHVIAFNSPFLIKAANTIFNIDNDTILELYDRSLLRKYDISRGGKSEYNLYYFHQSIKNEVEKLQDTNFEKLYIQKFVEFYWDLLYQTYKLLSTPDVSLAINRFNVIYDGDKNDFDRSLEFADKNDSSYIAELLGLIVSGFGQYTKAIEYQEKSLVIAKEIGDIVGIARNLILIATSLIKLEKNSEAISTAKQSKNILLELQEKIGQTIPLMTYVEQIISDLKK